jgi:histidine kinase
MLSKLRNRLIWKLFATFMLVILVGVLAWGVAIELVIPTVFERHMTGMSSMQMDAGMMGRDNLFTSFRSAMNEVLVWGAAASILAALVVSWLLSRQLVAPVQEMMLASQNIAGGRYEQRVAAPDSAEAADELGRLALSFNRMAEQLEQIEEMRLQLIGDISHELRTPLTSIKGSMEGLIDGILPATPETFQTVHREADRLQRLVMDLQELSRAEAGAYRINPERLSVQQLLDAIRQRLEPQFVEKGVKLEVVPLEEDLMLLADEDRTMQILTNLLGNALQYTAVGGTVRLAVLAKGGDVEFSAHDTGIGIAPEHLPHLFKRFFRVDKSRSRASGGSGIGLTIARHFIEAQGGQIWAASEGLGEGATFTFTLPLTD